MDYLDVLKTLAAFGTLGLGIVAGRYTLLSYRNSVLWKHAELASQYLKELNADEVLLFACRSLDWDIGILVVPQSLQPIIESGQPSSKVIHHRKQQLAQAMVVDPHSDATPVPDDAAGSPELQVYRTAMDSLLSWLSLVRRALGRGLFTLEDIEPAAWWVFRVDELSPALDGYMERFGYIDDINDLRRIFAGPIAKFKARVKADAVS